MKKNIEYQTWVNLIIYGIDTFFSEDGVDFFYHCLIGRVATEDISNDLCAPHLGQ